MEESVERMTVGGITGVAPDDDLKKSIDCMSVVFKKEKSEIKQLLSSYNNNVQVVKTILCKQIVDSKIEKYIESHSK